MASKIYTNAHAEPARGVIVTVGSMLTVAISLPLPTSSSKLQLDGSHGRRVSLAHVFQRPHVGLRNLPRATAERQGLDPSVASSQLYESMGIKLQRARRRSQNTGLCAPSGHA